MKKLRIACIGAGYFAPFHLDAWERIEEVELVALCDLNEGKARTLADRFQIPQIYQDSKALFEGLEFDVIDIITPPDSHLALCQEAARRGIHIICQKPLAPKLKEAKSMIEFAEAQQVKLIVHENWRFQPWYREMKRQIDKGAIGDQLYSLYFQMRTGDGWPEDAYMSRQPYFRSMPRLLVYETGIHFIDTFRYLAGEVQSVYADLRKLNQGIEGEDCGMIQFKFESGARGIWDANRYNEPNHQNPRYTFGTMLIEGSGGSIRLYADGKMSLQALGKPETPIPYKHTDQNFGGDCVYHFQQHVVKAFFDELPFETEGKNYVQNLEIQEAVYRSSEEERLIYI